MPQSEHHHHPRAKLKVWIRGLPPAMTEEEFKELLESITPPNNKSIDWQRLVPANKRVPTTTAYLHFSNEEALFGLFSKLDGHKFIDAKGREYRALIEYAPYQKIPRKKVIDKREGTIEKDADFIAFQEKLESELNMKVESAEAWLERREQEAQAAKDRLKALLSAEGENGVVVHEVVHTPLLDYLREKKERDQRDRSKKRDEERRRKADEERQRRMGRSSDRKRRGEAIKGKVLLLESGKEDKSRQTWCKGSLWRLESPGAARLPGNLTRPKGKEKQLLQTARDPSRFPGKEASRREGRREARHVDEDEESRQMRKETQATRQKEEDEAVEGTRRGGQEEDRRVCIGRGL
ncbi:hypothetical protein GUITHDRAFT_142255 [Guillardia theta CCMP2712]|uniref:UPF3 domain-containing protein n=1 Tax=Guillardia theta (strain CCMP2712) TaxID=905079 RepID=L1IYA9_GUITC|nr:hypothetical protein GUITHDRAFT_142255 [Guillardia theta CCMP2712]EKX41097.1 hypothetical protein GUITHDRAFT_142255 [Guillardia theta CCMP2712]|eukprot:XP_005828077.1 hypothetical protein GUITHDRAFT_142255 [Guillardia theta CCMP2712]